MGSKGGKAGSGWIPKLCGIPQNMFQMFIVVNKESLIIKRF